MSNENKVDYGELFCEAVDTIVAERLNGISYDQTVLCTIIDDSLREQGKYRVTATNANTSFEAFSENTEYRNNTNVYVTIPEGDWTQTKFITGKKTNKDEQEKYVYRSPFATLVDVSGNLISTEIPSAQTGLVANEDDIFDGVIDDYSTITLWTYNNDASSIVTDNGSGLAGFTRLGIKGSFQSWLYPWTLDNGITTEVISGSYGLRLRVQTENDNIIADENKTGYYDFYLDAIDMNGNPYNFQTYFEQEKVFDISEIGKIVSMQLQFYEVPNSFKNKYDEQPIKWVNNLGDKLSPNLFVKDCYICVGYDAESFGDDEAVLYTMDTMTYTSKANDMENQKLIELRWVHDFGDDELKVVNDGDNLNADIRWYRYKLGNQSPDEYAGYHWEYTNSGATITERVSLDDIENITSYQLLYHYLNPGVVDDYENGLNGDVAYEQYYTYDFKPEYRVEKTQNENLGLRTWSDYSVIELWSDECLEYYNITNPELISIGSIGQSTSAITKHSSQTWEDVVRQGFVFHSNFRSVTDFYTGQRLSNKGCMHRIGFWEGFTFAYRMYWQCEESFGLLLKDNLWVSGGNNPTGQWNNIGLWEDIKGVNIYNDIYVSGSNPYKVTAYNGAYKLNPTSTVTRNSFGLRNVLTLFADSFGPWTTIQDKYGMRDYVPGVWVERNGEWVPDTQADQDIYDRLNKALDDFFYALDHPYYEVQLPPKKFTYNFVPDINLAQEKIKVIVLHDDNVIRTNVLTFENEREVVNQSTIDAMSAVTIVPLDETDGNYLIYDLGNDLIDAAEGPKERTLEVHFNGAQLTEADKVEWRIPVKDTMIVLDSAFYADASAIEGGVAYDTGDAATANYIIITRFGNPDGSIVYPNICQKYRIDNIYSQWRVNNTITCIVTQFKNPHIANKQLVFGPAGSTGTDFTFTLGFDEGKTALTVDDTSVVTVTARLYDNNNAVVDLSQYTTEWKILNNQYINIVGGNSITGQSMHTKEIQLKSTVDEVPTDNYEILQVTLMRPNEYDLVAYLPLPIRSDLKYKYISGATKLIYNSAGYIDRYYQGAYKIYSADDNGIINSQYGSWTLQSGVSGEENYLPTLEQQQIAEDGDIYYQLKATSVYVPGTGTEVCISCTIDGDLVWSQPLLIMQNKYPSAMLNKWDGSLKIDDATNTILSARMVAGRKESDNTFSGVMMGDWYGNDEADPLISNIEDYYTDHTGLYGFNHGAAAFGFRDDGTAFIGKPGSGRIEFDGNESIITSNRFEDGLGGLKIDLDDGQITGLSPTNVEGRKQGYLYIDVAHATTPFSIGTSTSSGRSNNFYVDWDGTVKATTGLMGVWELTEEGFSSSDKNFYLNADGTMQMGTSTDKITIGDGKITIGRSSGKVVLENGTVTIGSSNADSQVTINADTGIKLGDGTGQVLIKTVDGVGQVTIGNPGSSRGQGVMISAEDGIIIGRSGSDMRAFFTENAIRLGVDVGATYIDNESLNVRKINILSSVENGADIDGNIVGSIFYTEASGLDGTGFELSDPSRITIVKVTNENFGISAGGNGKSLLNMDDERVRIGMNYLQFSKNDDDGTGMIVIYPTKIEFVGPLADFTRCDQVNFTNVDTIGLYAELA